MRLLRPTALLGLILALVLTGCGGDQTPAAKPTTTPTSIARLDAGSMRVVRVAFCDLVPRTAVRSALGAGPTLSRSWRNGDRLREAGRQIGHEFGCAWFGPHRRAARAWVFAQPVRPTFATGLVRRAGQEHGCRGTASRLFGTPSVVQTCRVAPGVQRIRRAGLFGDTWLTCEVTGPVSTSLRARTDRWCVSVASALNAGRTSD
ncbi:hypothetical protein [Nocardioides marmorisolisilvae]|uniref:DUF3558 domain-containing protein n=1 Tax=Nocardioides marmorisolisilvae TaxID=1542737 RepID=A0A3N0DSU9_9ACTN|nr:hypothetical protein [Nocardioides marmorisolisilvae]RNL78680.1 hypothetical protein EFL95_06240 [Nocardioides marmorisolisilvae]